MKLKDIRDIWKGKRCFIFGNGKSLKQVDMRYFWYSFTFGTNRIYLLPYVPFYYVVEDELVVHDNHEEISKLTCPKFIPERYRSYFEDTEKAFFYPNDFEEQEIPRFTDGKSLYTGGTVTYQCLQLAYLMGFKEVYLIGVDHDYIMPETAVKKWDNAYISTGNDPNHFDPNYFGEGRMFHDPNMERMERAYLKAKEVFEADGRKIYNAGIGGKLEIFDRVDYRSLFK